MAGMWEVDFASDMVAVPKSSAAVPISLSGTPRAGDLIMKAVCIVSDPANCNVKVRDSLTGTDVRIAGAFQQTGTYTVLLGVKSSNTGAQMTGQAGWFATTDSGVDVVFVGRFR